MIPDADVMVAQGYGRRRKHVQERFSSQGIITSYDNETIK